MGAFKLVLSAFASIAVFSFYVSMVRPVGWFDAVIGLLLATLTFLFIRYRLF